MIQDLSTSLKLSNDELMRKNGNDSIEDVHILI